MRERGNTKRLGTVGEEAAAAFLVRAGVCILERNFRRRGGEIDLIGRDGAYLIVVEVKLRKNTKSGTPGEAVSFLKQRKICRTFNYYRMEQGISDFVPVRFDVVEVDRTLACHWIKNAFSYQE